MLRNLLAIATALSLSLPTAFAAPVAVDDSYSTNEDSPLQTGGGSIFSATFDSINLAAGAWAYLDKLKNNQAGQTPDDYPLDGAGLNWKALNYDTATSVVGPWGSGALPLVGGVVDAVPTAPSVLTGQNSTASTVTTYLFRKVVTVDAPTAAIASWNLRAVADDGAIFYLNGVEIARLGMDSATWQPSGALSTLTGTPASGNELTYTDIAVNLAGNLVAGANVLAVEVHQSYAGGNYGSSDIGIDFSLSPASSGAAGFTYADNTFGTNAPDAYATGNLVTDFGNPGSSLNIAMVRAEAFNNRNVSGGWSRTINLPTAGTLRISFDARVRMLGGFETGEFGQAILAVNGTRYGPVGTAPNLSLIQTSGGGNAVSEVPSTWQSFTIDIPGLAAGDHTILLGGFVNRPADASENCQVYFDNVNISVVGGGSGILANDTGGAVSAALVAGPSNGTLNLLANGNFTYTPTANFSGTDSFTYTASDGVDTSAPATVSITVNAVNDAPTGTLDSYTTNRNTTLNVPAASGVLINDSDIDSPLPSLTAVLGANAANGNVTLNANGSFTYTPNTDFAGADTFSYRVSDGTAQSALVSVNITVSSMSPPTGVADSYTMVRNTSLVVTATAAGTVTEDVIPYGATGWKYLDNGTDQGTAWRNIGFNDSAWATGTAELGYGDNDEVTVVGFGPDSANKYVTTYFRKVVNVSDIHRVTNVEISLIYDDGGVVYVNGNRVHATPSMAVDPAYNSLAPINSEQLTLTTSYTVPQSFLVEGPNTIAVEIHQNTVGSSDLTMNLRMRLTKSVYAGVLANDTDIENDPMTAALVTGPANGTLTLNANGTFTYTPTAAYLGTDSFVYRAVDATGPSANTTATITIVAGPNQAPLTSTDIYNGTEDTVLTVAAAQGALANDTDGEGDSFTAELAGGLSPANAGVLSFDNSGAFTFTPSPDFFGTAAFTYRARDVGNAASAPTTVTLNIAGTNDAPVGVANTYSTDPEVNLTIPAPGVLGNDSDVDGNPLTASLVSGLSPAGAGALVLNADGSFTYAPAIGFSGTATFVYRANDGLVNSGNTTVTLRINGRPVANDDAYSATEDTPLSIAAPGVLADDTDPESDPLSAILVAGPAANTGAITLDANGSFTFTPVANFNGVASFTYNANDGARDSVAPATVTINVAPVNDAPAAVADFYGTATDAQLVVQAVAGLLVNDTDVESQPLTVALFGQPSHGAVAVNGDGSFVYTPNAGFTGLDAFTYRATDGSAQSGIATVSVNVGFDPANVVINELMYHPISDIDGEEYIELHNRGTVPVPMAGWKFTSGVNFTFPAVTIPAGGYLVVAANSATFTATYGSVPLLVGGWTGTLSNSGEKVRLQYPNSAVADGYSTADEVTYSREGDWGVRRALALGGETGFDWMSKANGFGDSLELINPALSNSNGQNWTKRETTAAGNQRTPGIANTDLAANPAYDSAPLISSVKHRPQIPVPGQTVNVTAKLTDELATGVSGTVFWRTWVPNQNVATTPAANFSSIAMADDGLHGDGLANDGEFGATIPAQAVNTIVEFYIRATDSGARARTFPAPTTAGGTQGANCLYQVDDEVWNGRQPIYRLIATGGDQYEFDTARWAQASDAAINVTFISTQESDIDVRYQCAIRVRGAGSRSNVPRNWKLEWPGDDDFNGQRKANLNIAYAYNQYIGAQLMKMANLPHEGATPVQVRLNKTNYAGSTSSAAKYSYGMYVHMQPNSEQTYVDENFSTDSSGNIYKKVRPHQNFTLRSDGTGGPNVTQYLADGWTKESNTGANNWTDLHTFHQMLNKVGGYTVADMEPIMDVDQWCRALAFATIVDDAETNISNGSGDDYSVYFGVIDPRVKLLMHDYDTILGGGDTTTNAGADGLYQMLTNAGPSGHLSNGETLAAFTSFFSDPVVNQRFKAQIRELLDTVFLPANFDAMIDAQLTDWVSPGAGNSLPVATRTAMKTFNATRRTFLLGLINGTFSAATTLPVTNGYPTTTTATDTGLSGTVDPVTTRKVTVNGVPVALNNYISGGSGSGTWTVGSAVTLLPGLNHVVVRALGKNDVVVATQTFEIVYDDASVQTVSSISGNTVWTAAGGPYRITTVISVDDETLNIQPGATVFMDSGAGINVLGSGRILAEGTPDQPITIVRTPGSTGSWNGIFLDEAAEESRFSNVIFNHNASTAIIAQTGSRVVVDRVTFRNAGVPYVSFSDSSFVVSNTVFPDSTAAFQPVSGAGGMAGGEAVIRDCVFGKTLGANAAVTFANLKRPGAILQVIGNVFNGSQADLIQLNGCDGWIEGNTFMHAHRNSAAVTASAISGGSSGALKSNVTIIRNRIYDCDHAVTMRQGNSFAAIQNTIVRITNAGGTDTGSGVFNFANAAETPGAGAIAEANIIWDAAALTRNYNSSLTMLSLDNNVLPVAWTGSGTDNTVSDPLLTLTAIAVPATATAAEVATAFTPASGSPAIGRGTLGVVDRGAGIPGGIIVGGVPVASTPLATASLFGGPNGGFASFPAYGYTHYKYALDGGAYGAETSISSAISLGGLTVGVHTVSVLGKNDAGVWQTTPTTVSWTVDPSAVTVQINEILASNVSAYPVGATRSDMIELFNYGTLPVSLANFSVSDNPALPRKYVFPAGTTIPAGGYLVLLGDAPNANPGIHINFGLDGDGDSFAIYPPNAVIGTAPVDSVSFGIQIPDSSIGRTGVARTWELNIPTPLAANVGAATGSNTVLKINEWCGTNDFIIIDDFLELYNPTNGPIALGGMLLSADLQVAADHVIAPLSFIRPNGFVRFIADGNASAGPNHLSWGISKLRESMRLLTSTGVLVDQVVSGPQRTDQSEGRATDGSTALAFFTLPTPGYSNGTPLSLQQEILDNIRITEVMYNPTGGTNGPEFVELKNISSVLTLNLTGVKFVNGIDYAFPDNTTLAPGAFLVLTSNPTAFQTAYGFQAFNHSTGAYIGKFADGGERVRLEIDGYQLGILDFTYSNAWYPTANGTGASIEIVNPTATRASWELKESWRATAPNPGQQGVFGVVAGDDAAVSMPAVLNLSAVLSYGSQNPGSVTTAWTKDSGPGTVGFSAPAALETTASFSLPGVYVLRLTATGTASVFDTITVTVQEDYASWATRVIGSNSATNGMLNDADGDKLSNLLEYAFGSNPLAGTPSLLTAFNSGGLFAINFTRSSNANVIFAVEVADDLSGPWTSDTIVVNMQSDNGLIQQWTGYDNRPISGATKRFIRVRVTGN